MIQPRLWLSPCIFEIPSGKGREILNLLIQLIGALEVGSYLNVVRHLPCFRENSVGGKFFAALSLPVKVRKPPASLGMEARGCCTRLSSSLSANRTPLELKVRSAGVPDDVGSHRLTKYLTRTHHQLNPPCSIKVRVRDQRSGPILSSISPCTGHVYTAATCLSRI